MAKYTLTNRQKLSPSCLLFTLEPSGERGIGFEPGQYVSIRFKRYGRPTPARCFSVVNTPNNAGTLQLGVRVEGKFTTAFSELAIGSELIVDGSFGQFYFDPDYDKKSVLIAGGIGITPILSIVKGAIARRNKNPLTVLYSCRSQDDVPFAQELYDLEQKNANVRVVFVITSGSLTRFPAGAHVMNGRITPELIAQACQDDYENTSFFVCGPQGFMDKIEKTLRANQTPDWRINIESFVQAHASRDGGFGAAARKIFSVYGMAAMGFFVVLSVIFGTDIYHYSAAAASAQPATSQTTSGTSTTQSTTPAQTTPTQTTPVTTNDTSSNSNASSNSSSSNTNSQTTTTPTYYQTYQRPVSSVS